jgi:hypothetical protein
VLERRQGNERGGGKEAERREDRDANLQNLKIDVFAMP